MHYHVVRIDEEGEYVDPELTFDQQDEAEARAVAVAREIDGPGWSGKRYPGRSWRRQSWRCTSTDACSSARCRASSCRSCAATCPAGSPCLAAARRSSACRGGRSADAG